MSTMIQRNDLIPIIETLYKNYGGLLQSEFNLFQIDVPHNLMDDSFVDWKGVYRPYYKDLYIHKGSVNPGKDAILNHEGGAAKVKNGFYKDVWVIDIHAKSNPAFAHEAFCQRLEYKTESIDIHRLDRQGNITATVQSGNEFGINRHRCSIQSDVTSIGLYGAGCSISPNHSDHEQEIAWAKSTSMYQANKRCKWSLLQISASEVTGL